MKAKVGQTAGGGRHLVTHTAGETLTMTVGEFLLRRIREAGVRHAFGVPGKTARYNDVAHWAYAELPKVFPQVPPRARLSSRPSPTWRRPSARRTTA
jgi:hypothetical protein